MRTRVIVPLDGSAHAHDAIPYGAWLAGRRDAELVFVRVAADPLASQVEEDLAVALAGAGMPATSVVRHGGDVTEELAAEAAGSDDAIICYSTRVGHRLAEVVRTGFSTSLIGAATCPLLLVGPACRRDPNHVKAVMACLDGSELSERVLPLVDDLAIGMDLDVWLAQIVEPGGSGQYAGSPGDFEADTYLARQASRLRHAVTNQAVLHGLDVADAIVAHGKACEGTMPAVATHGRAGVSLVLWGSVALRVADDGLEPVLVVPPGWVARG